MVPPPAEGYGSSLPATTLRQVTEALVCPTDASAPGRILRAPGAVRRLSPPRHGEPAMFASHAPSVEDLQNEFVSFLPELTSRFTMRFRRYSLEKRAEALAEAIALAWTNFVSARNRGKAVTIGTLAFYVGRLVASGRRMAGVATKDVMAPEARTSQGHPRCVSMEQEGVSHVRFYRTFGDKSWKWPVLDYVAPLLDLESFLAGCDSRDRRIVAMKLQGHPQNTIASRLGISPPAVTQRLDRLHRQWEAVVTG